MLSDAMRSVARDAGLDVVPYQSDLGFTAIRESDDRYFMFILNTGEWMVYLDLRRFSGEGLAHSAAIFSNCAGLVKSRAEWRRTGL